MSLALCTVGGLRVLYRDKSICTAADVSYQPSVGGSVQAKGAVRVCLCAHAGAPICGHVFQPL